MKIEFFEGRVQIIDSNYHTTRFRIVDNEAVVDVRNNLHIRFKDKNSNFSSTFSILAPTTGIDMVKGDIPKNHIQIYPISHYQKLNAEYTKGVQEQLKTTSSNLGIDPYSPECHYATNPLKKEDLASYFDYSKSDWEHYSQNMNFPESTSAKVFTEYEGNNFRILVKVGEERNLGYSMTAMFREGVNKIDSLKIEHFFPKGLLTEDQLKLYRNVDKTTNPLLKPEYSSYATFQEEGTIDRLSITVKKNR